jgi:membrane protein required for colicin V production|tara:strand:- start:1958 stop:2449 length:492 start_codon:yes stop_codon:yes gene_type:complete
MNEVDAIILVIIGLSCLFGIWRGLVKEVLSLVTWVAALTLARLYSGVLADFIGNLISNESARYVTAFAIVFVFVMMTGTLINHVISKLLTITGLKLVDRLLGGAFGVVRGSVIIVVILFVTGVFVNETPQWQESQLIPYGLSLIEWTQLYIDIDDVNSVEPVI